MVRVAIVEDEPKSAQRLSEYLSAYSDSNGVLFNIVNYTSAETFIANYKTDIDVVFMDIELPNVNGMDAAKRLREIDKLVTIIFVTHVRQFAAKGYAVGAADFIVKPVSYYGLATTLDRVLPTLVGNKGGEIVVKTPSGMRRLSVNNISYVEVRSHKLIYHTESDIVEAWGSLNELEARPEFKNFARGNNGYLINLRYVFEVDGCDVKVLNDNLALSRHKRKEFIRRLNEFLGER